MAENDYDRLHFPVRIRIDYLDGLRGLSAFYVMVSHAFSLATYTNGALDPTLNPWFVWATGGLNCAHYAVAVFIVLSGFCLMLPVARSQDQALPGGLCEFAKRRARRIFPPYYITLALVLGILFVSHRYLKSPGETRADMSRVNIISHLFLIHNLFPKYSQALDGPMWSVAWEWQIYFIFALVLLPIWRRFGITLSVLSGFVLSALPIIFLEKDYNFDWTCPYYVGLFTFGMAAAVFMCSPAEKFRLIKNAQFQNIAISFLLVATFWFLFFSPQWLEHGYYWIGDTFIGAFTALLILFCANNSNPNFAPKIIVNILEARIFMGLGQFSYSLYLLHYPILTKMQNIMHQRHFSHYSQLPILLSFGVPACLCASYLFHLAFERPFMTRKSKGR